MSSEQNGSNSGLGRRILCCARSTSPGPPKPPRPARTPRPNSRASYSLPVLQTTTLNVNIPDSGYAPPIQSLVSCINPVVKGTNPGGGRTPPAIPSPQPRPPDPSPSPDRQGATIAPVGQDRSAMITGAGAVPNSLDPADDIFREALNRYKLGLDPVLQQAFLGASAVKLIDVVQGLNKQHSEESRARQAATKVQGFLQVADGYLNVLGVLVQHSPEFSSLVVGGLRLFVDIGRRYGGFFDKVNETMQTLSSHLDILSRYARLYVDDAKVKNALCDAYGDLINFCKTVCGIFMNKDGKLSNKISTTVLFKQLSSPLEISFDAINTQFSEHITKIEKTAYILEVERKHLKESLEARENAVRQRGELLSWLSKLKPEDDLERIYAKRHANTGMWLVESEELKRWSETCEHCLLWCYGDAGVGKSVLASILVEEITSKHLFDECIGIAYFYFSFQNEITQMLSDILSILIKQLCRRKKELPMPLQALYRECSLNSKSPTLLELQVQLRTIIGTFEEVFLVVDAVDECKEDNRKQLLSYIVSLFGQCSGKLKIFVTSRPESDIKRAFTSEKFQTVKIWATKVSEDIASYVRHELVHRTHHHCDIDQDLREEIENTLVSGSGGMFLWVRCQLDYIYQLPSKPDIRNALKSLPADMTRTYQRILDRIYNQPEPMVIVAKRALTWVITARRPLTPDELAIAIAIEPISNSTTEVIDKYRPQVAIDACCGLLTSDWHAVRPIHFTVKEFLKGGGRGIPNEVEANAELARSSIQYMLCEEFIEGAGICLSRGEEETGLCERMFYTFSFWNQHVRRLSLPLPDDLRGLLWRFFSSKHAQKVYAAAIEDRDGDISASLLGVCAMLDLLPIYLQFYVLDGSVSSSWEVKEALHRAASAGPASAVSTLLDLINEEDSRDSYPMYLAAEAGRVETVQLFIDRGVDVNASHGSAGSTALYGAASEGREAVVRTLIEHGAYVNAQGGEYGTALQAAAYGGHQTVIETLLANGADANAQGGRYGTALQAAARCGRKVMVETLLANGANVNIQGGECGTALQAAVTNNSQTVAETLLSKGADVNAQCGGLGTALQDAAHFGRKAIVKTLLANGADVNIQGGEYGTALQAAVARRVIYDNTTLNQSAGEDITSILLDNGADVNAQGGKYGTALQAAVLNGYQTVTETLLSKGADVNIQGGIYGTALQAAGYWGYKVIVETLLVNGADVNACGGRHGTALQAAAHQGHNMMVETLLANGADVNIQGGRYGTALQAACAAYKCHLTVVETLLANGADANAQGGRYGTALQAAAHWSHKAIVETLLANGADVNIQVGEYGTALQAAATERFANPGVEWKLSQEDIIKALLARGVNVNLQGGKYGSALQAAASGGHETIVEILLANGADVNNQVGEYGNALHAAAACKARSRWPITYDTSHIENITKALLAKGANVNAQGGRYGTALQAAAYQGSKAIVEILLVNGGDANIQDGEYGTALQAAAASIDESTYGKPSWHDIVKVLLSNGADVNIRGGKYGTALQAAAYCGHKMIVETLLANGADVNTQGGEYGTALQAAAAPRPISNDSYYRRSSREHIIKILLANGADINAQGGKYGNALAASRESVGTPFTRLLLGNGAKETV